VWSVSGVQRCSFVVQIAASVARVEAPAVVVRVITVSDAVGAAIVEGDTLSTAGACVERCRSTVPVAMHCEVHVTFTAIVEPT
jgi:hypothetical protein